jgi:hypothetical protein
MITNAASIAAANQWFPARVDSGGLLSVYPVAIGDQGGVK